MDRKTTLRLKSMYSMGSRLQKMRFWAIALLENLASKAV
jgi:hypothetical protein